MEEQNDDSSPVHQSNPSVKRRKISVSDLERESQLTDLGKELDRLIEYYNEVMREKESLIADSLLIRSVFACLLEESSLSYSKLVLEIHEKLKGREGITLGYVRASILELGHRQLYGIVDADVDVLEDEKENSLGCWETKNLKHIPEIHHADLKTRRFCRKKIQERIKAVTGMIAALERPLSDSSPSPDFNNLVKVLKEADIRMWVEDVAARYKTEMEVNIKVNAVKKELESMTREAEKERKQDDKIILLAEKELKRFQEDSEKEAKSREKQEGQIKKKIKKLQDEAEKKRQKWGKELSNVRKRVSCVKQQCALDKQASMMDRLAKSKARRVGGSSTTVGPSSPVSYGTPTNSEAEDTTTPTTSASSLERYAST